MLEKTRTTIDWLIQGVRIENADKMHRALHAHREHLIGLLDDFIKGVRNGEQTASLLAHLTDIHSAAEEVFRIEEEAVQENVNSLSYRESVRSKARRAKQFEILVDIDQVIQRNMESTAKDGVKRAFDLSCISHSVDALILHLALDGRPARHEMAA